MSGPEWVLFVNEEEVLRSSDLGEVLLESGHYSEDEAYIDMDTDGRPCLF